jgi:hypothetical protein
MVRRSELLRFVMIISFEYWLDFDGLTERGSTLVLEVIDGGWDARVVAVAQDLEVLLSGPIVSPLDFRFDLFERGAAELIEPAPTFRVVFEEGVVGAESN